jgi:hypothetical protein
MEFLKEYLGPELYGQVEAKLKGNEKVQLANLAGGEYVAKTKADETETARTQLQAQLTDRDKQLEELKKQATGNTDLQVKITELQTANAKQLQELQGQLSQAQLDRALDARLLKEGAVNLKAVRALMDLGKVKLDGENLTGLDDQLKAIRDTEKWAFGQPTVPGSGSNPPPTAPTDNPSRPTGKTSF